MIGYRRLVTGFELAALAAVNVSGGAINSTSLEWEAGNPNGGGLVGVDVRFPVFSGGGTVAIRIVVASKKHLGSASTAATVPVEAKIFDETIAAFAAGSATARCNDVATARFDAEPWVDGIKVFITFTYTGDVNTAGLSPIVALEVVENR